MLGKAMVPGRQFRGVSMSLESRLLQAKKLESLGQLAAGIAHEANTPTQYVSDNTTFLQDAFTNRWRIIEGHKQLLKEAREGEVLPLPDRLEQLERDLEEYDLELFTEEVPSALEQALEELALAVSSAQDVGKGTDQGLSIANSVVVDQHAGELILLQNEGCGAEFIVRLPLQNAMEQREIESTTQ